MGRDTGFGIYGPDAAVKELYDSAPYWCADGQDLSFYAGGMAALDFLYWRNRHELASMFEGVFGPGDSSSPKTIRTERGDFIGVEVDPGKFCAVTDRLASFVENWDELGYDNAVWFLNGLGVQMGRAAYWNARRDEMERLGVKFFWYDSY